MELQRKSDKSQRLSGEQKIRMETSSDTPSVQWHQVWIAPCFIQGRGLVQPVRRGMYLSPGCALKSPANSSWEGREAPEALFCPQTWWLSFLCDEVIVLFLGRSPVFLHSPGSAVSLNLFPHFVRPGQATEAHLGLQIGNHDNLA